MYKYAFMKDVFTNECRRNDLEPKVISLTVFLRSVVRFAEDLS